MYNITPTYNILLIFKTLCLSLETSLTMLILCARQNIPKYTFLHLSFSVA